MLDSFVVLGDAPAKRILAFARRWGVLTRSDPSDPTWRRTEPIAGWQLWARAAQSGLNIAAAAYLDKRVSLDDWKATQATCPRHELDERLKPGDPSTYGFQIEHFVNEWLDFADVRPAVAWRRDEDPEMEFRAQLIGVLGIQVMQAVVRSEGLFFCAWCGRAYAPTRLPREGQRSFCPTCSKNGVAHRLAVRDDRRRKREKRGRQKGRAE